MVTDWSGLPFIIRNPYLPPDIAHEPPSDLVNKPRYVSVEKVEAG
jgi:hypothetical protein